MNLTYEKLDPSLPDLAYARDGDAGFDLYASPKGTPVMLVFGEEVRTVPTGYRFHIPEGYELQIRPRSGLTSKGILAQFGTVDSGYRGEVMVNLMSINEYEYDIKQGDRIAQAVLAPVTRAVLQQGTVSTDTERGELGFGSTGR